MKKKKRYCLACVTEITTEHHLRKYCKSYECQKERNLKKVRRYQEKQLNKKKVVENE